MWDIGDRCLSGRAINNAEAPGKDGEHPAKDCELAEESLPKESVSGGLPAIGAYLGLWLFEAMLGK